jgi:hypothetical protein
MTYEVKNHPPEVPTEDKDAEDGRPLRTRVAAGTVASALALAALPHGAACAKADSLASLLCEPQQSIRHQPHIEQGSTSSASAGMQIAPLVTLINESTAPGVTIRPPATETYLQAYAPEIRVGPRDPS